MTSITPHENNLNRSARLLPPAARYALLLAGCVAAALASGSRWDVMLAAWIAPVLVLRFSRDSGVATATLGSITAALVQTATYLVANAIPFNAMTAALGAVVSVAYASPAILDRTIGRQLPLGQRIFLFPAAAVTVEFLVGAILPLGTAVGMRAITQAENLAFVQILSVTGPYAVAFLIGCVATVANLIFESPSSKSTRRWSIGLTATLATVITAGQLRLDAATPSGAARSVMVAAVTPDLHARLSANNLLSTSPHLPPGQLAPDNSTIRAANLEIADGLLKLTDGAARAGARIIVWSETAAASTEKDKAALLARIALLARQGRIYINATIGVPRERNEMYLFGPAGQQLWHYRKNHPVPGMEPVAPFSNPVPVAVTPYGRLAGLICFDGDFPGLARVDADILLAPSWDWPEVSFTHTMRMVRLRAIENGYSLIRPVFNGVAGAFDGYGRVLAMQSTMSPGAHVMMVELPVGETATIYGKIGDAFAWLGMVLLAVLISTRLWRMLPMRRAVIGSQ